MFGGEAGLWGEDLKFDRAFFGSKLGLGLCQGDRGL